MSFKLISVCALINSFCHCLIIQLGIRSEEDGEDTINWFYFYYSYQIAAGIKQGTELIADIHGVGHVVVLTAVKERNGEKKDSEIISLVYPQNRIWWHEMKLYDKWTEYHKLYIDRHASGGGKNMVCGLPTIFKLSIERQRWIKF